MQKAWSGVINMASYANFINAEVQSHYANETYVNSLDKYSSLKLKFLPSNFFLIFGVKPKKKKSDEDCLTSLQSCFSTGEIYSCIVDIFFFVVVVGRYTTAHGGEREDGGRGLPAAGSQSKRQRL